MDKHINPTNGDYSGAQISDLGNAVFLRIMTRLGSYWADPTMGSKLYLLARSKDLQRVLPLAVAYTREALQPILADGRATAIDVVAEWRHDGMLRLLSTITQAGGVQQTFDHFVAVQ